VEESKVAAIKEWPTLENISQVRSFHDLAGFNKRFVKDFSTIAAPLNELTEKGVVFKWGEKDFSTIAAPLNELTKISAP
jgi:hypothetical protein